MEGMEKGTVSGMEDVDAATDAAYGICEREGKETADPEDDEEVTGDDVGGVDPGNVTELRLEEIMP